jgi:hypothetical protein
MRPSTSAGVATICSPRLLRKLDDGTINKRELDELQQTLAGDGSDLVPYFVPKIAAARTKLGG